jgi:hypothetical protein
MKAFRKNIEILPRFVPESAKLEQAIKANLRGQGFTWWTEVIAWKQFFAMTEIANCF